MARFVRGDVVVIPFPFSDLSQAKRRPALVLAELEGNDRILCQITSQLVQDKYAIQLDEDDFAKGGLKQTSQVSYDATQQYVYSLDRGGKIISHPSPSMKGEAE